VKTLPQNFLSFYKLVLYECKKWLSVLVTIEIEDSKGHLGNDTLHKMWPVLNSLIIEFQVILCMWRKQSTEYTPLVSILSYVVTLMRFGLVNGVVDHLYYSNYSATANLHNSQITTAAAKPFSSLLSSPAISWQQLLTVEILQLHMLRSCLHSLPCRTLYWTD
jgi:hypothetical protein